MGWWGVYKKECRCILCKYLSTMRQDTITVLEYEGTSYVLNTEAATFTDTAAGVVYKVLRYGKEPGGHVWLYGTLNKQLLPVDWHQAEKLWIAQPVD